MSDSDQKNVDLILLTVGVLIGVAVGLFIIARDMGNANMARMQLEDPVYQAAVNTRIEPFGQVALVGEEVVADPELTRVTEAEEATVLLTGPQVYNAAGLACHGGGIAGAPMTGDKAAWAPRIAQGMDTLQKHAIEGLQGSSGFMPPKGGRSDLSDEEIIAAVEYLVQQVQ